MLAQHCSVLVSGQSNASTVLQSKIVTELNNAGFPNNVAQYNQGGTEIAQWIEADGTKGPEWAPMMAALDASMQLTLNSGTIPKSLRLVWFQGERDILIDEGSLYQGRFQMLVDTFIAEASALYNIPIEVSAALVWNLNTGSNPIIINRINTNLPLVRGAVVNVANSTAGVTYFETNDIGRQDDVHITINAAMAEMCQVAVRAIA